MKIVGELTEHGWECLLCPEDSILFTFLVSLYRHLRDNHNLDLFEYRQENNLIVRKD